MIKKILLGLVIVSTIGWAYQTKTDDNAEGNNANQEEKGVPNYINYQGYLTDNSGNPINGSKSITFSIWTALSGGIQVWTTTLTVSVEKGLFYKDLSVPHSVFSSGARRWLQIKVDTQTLSPRTEITSAGFSYRTTKSDTSSYANNSDKLDNHNWGDLYPNADKVDGFNANSSPASNNLFPLSVTQNTGTINNSSNPVDWTKLKNVPSGFADGVDNSGGGENLSQTLLIGNSAGSYNINMNGRRIENLGDPNSGDDVMDRDYADDRYINEGAYIYAGNSDRVDGYHASSTPSPNKILPLTSNGQFYHISSYSTPIYARTSNPFGSLFNSTASSGIGLTGYGGGIGMYCGDNFQCSGYATFSGGKSGYVVDICRSDETGLLEEGDIVMITGVSSSVVGEIPVVNVKKTSEAYCSGVIGVVDRHFEKEYSSELAAIAKEEGLRTDATICRYGTKSSINWGEYLSVETLGAYKSIKADASYGSIKPGDLLTSSPTPG